MNITKSNVKKFVGAASVAVVLCAGVVSCGAKHFKPVEDRIALCADLYSGEERARCELFSREPGTVQREDPCEYAYLYCRIMSEGTEEECIERRENYRRRTPHANCK